VTEGSHIPWPEWESLSPTFKNSQETINQDVYNAAGEIWPQAISLAVKADIDESLAYIAMMAAVVGVSRIPPESIELLSRYLFKAYRRQLFEHGRKMRSAEIAVPIEDYNLIDDHVARQIEQKILLEEIVARMDEETLQIYEKLILGHSFEQIARAQDEHANVLRSRFSKRLKKIATEINYDRMGRKS